MKTQPNEHAQQIIKGPHRYEESSMHYVAEPPYKHQAYPKVKYHVHNSKRTVLVTDEDHEKKLDPEWHDQRPAVKHSSHPEDNLRRENKKLKKQLAELQKPSPQNTADPCSSA